jgi:hypothetical protein
MNINNNHGSENDADINISNFNERMAPLPSLVQSLKTPKPMQPLVVG